MLTYSQLQIFPILGLNLLLAIGCSNISQSASIAAPPTPQAKLEHTIHAPQESTRNITQEVQQLIQALKTQPDDRTEVSEKLAAIGQPAISHILPLLTDSNPRLRSSAAYILGQMGTVAQSTVAQLVPLLKDSDRDVRRITAEALGSMGNAAKLALPEILTLLKDPDSDRRITGLYALGQINFILKTSDREFQSVLPHLIPLLQDDDPVVSLGTAQVLGSLGESVKPALPQILPFLKHSNPSVRIYTLYTLEWLGKTAKSTIPQITPLLKDANSEVRDRAAATLKHLKQLSN